MAKKHVVRREACPGCQQGPVSVTYEQVINGSGQVAHQAPIRVEGCETEECEHFDPRTKSKARQRLNKLGQDKAETQKWPRGPEDPNEAAARTVRQATEGK